MIDTKVYGSLVQRWQQAEDDELLYAPDPGYGTTEEAVSTARASFRRDADARQQETAGMPATPREEPEG